MDLRLLMTDSSTQWKIMTLKTTAQTSIVNVVGTFCPQTHNSGVFCSGEGALCPGDAGLRPSCVHSEAIKTVLPSFCDCDPLPRQLSCLDRIHRSLRIMNKALSIKAGVDIVGVWR